MELIYPESLAAPYQLDWEQSLNKDIELSLLFKLAQSTSDLTRDSEPTTIYATLGEYGLTNILTDGGETNYSLNFPTDEFTLVLKCHNVDLTAKGDWKDLVSLQTEEGSIAVIEKDNTDAAAFYPISGNNFSDGGATGEPLDQFLVLRGSATTGELTFYVGGNTFTYTYNGGEVFNEIRLFNRHLVVDRGLNGAIEYLHFWSRALSDEEIAIVEANPYQLFKQEEDVRDEYCLVLGSASNTVTFPLVGAWTGEITYSDGTTSLESGTDAFVLDGTTPISITKFSATDSTQDYFWEFNQTRGDTVKCHYTGELATLVGFPVDSGYVRGDDGQIVGYQVGTATITLPITGAYTGLLTYADDSTLALSGSGDLLLDSSHELAIKSVEITVSKWDFTTGDSDQIIDTVGGNHATISNASTVKWQPVIDKQVFTVGSGMDYETFAAFVSAQGDAYQGVYTGYRKKALLSSETLDYTGTVHYDRFYDGLDIEGDVSNKPILSGTIDIRVMDMLVSGVEFSGKTTIRSYSDPVKRALFEYCSFVNHEGSDRTLIINNRESRLTIQHCFIWQSNDNPYDIVTVSSPDILTMNNCVVIDDVNTVFSTNHEVIGFPQNAFLYDNLIVSRNPSRTCIEATKTGSNNLTSDATAETLGIGTQDENLITYFTDPDSGDFTINEVGQAALAGQGFNGSNIAEWLYAEGDLITVDLQLSDSEVNPESDVYSIATIGTIGLSSSTVSVTSDLLSVVNIDTIGLVDTEVTPESDLITVININVLDLTDSAVHVSSDQLAIINIDVLQLSDSEVNPESDVYSIDALSELTLSDSEVNPESDIYTLTNIGMIGLTDSELLVTSDLMSLADVDELVLTDSEVNPVSDIYTGITSLDVLELTDSEVNPNSDIYSLTGISVVSLLDTELNATIDTMTLESIIVIGLGDTEVNPVTDTMHLFFKAMPNFSFDDLILTDSSVSYSLADNTIEYNLKAK